MSMTIKSENNFADILKTSHQKAFTVAKADEHLAQTTHSLINATLQNGDGFALFRKQLTEALSGC